MHTAMISPDEVRPIEDTPEPRVSFAADTDHAAALEQAIAILRREGVVVLDDLTDPMLLARCWSEIEAGYPDLETVDRTKNHGPYEGRHTVPLVIDNTLAEEQILLPEPVRNIARDILDAEYKVDTVGLLVALAGSPTQKPHVDGLLFPGTPLNRVTPPFAFAFVQPLVPMTETTGRTAFWRGSHRVDKPDGSWDFAPEVNPGSAILWDFRIWHCGLANISDASRPVLFTVLAREWWTEDEPPAAIHYKKLSMARHVHDALTPKWKRRFHRARIVDSNISENEHAQN